MAKRAGLKNDGKWFRTNKAISALSDDEKQALGQEITAMDSTGNAFTAYRDLVSKAGLESSSDFPSSIEEWITNLVNDGIPRQLWLGQLSYDSYTKVVEEGKTFYRPDHQADMRLFGSELRDTVAAFMVYRRQARDLANVGTRAEGNPGGDPDGNPGT